MLNGLLYLLLVLVTTLRLRNRWPLLRSFTGFSEFLFCLGLTFFFLGWINFGAYLLLGWGTPYVWATWAVPLVWLTLPPRRSAALPETSPPTPVSWRATWGLPRGEWLLFGFFLVFVSSRFFTGLSRSADGSLWCNFNFVDTAFHLSVVNSLLAAPHFPPVDLDMAPAPLKYHFLADFFVAHLHQLGLSPLKAMWAMNLISSATLVGAIWTCFKRWLRLPPGWVLLAGLIFLFLNTSLINIAHFVVLNPPFFRVQSPVDGILLYPFFNFEASLGNLFEPQRGLLFAFPALLFILDLTYGFRRSSEAGLDPAKTENTRALRALSAFILVCLLPFAHIVGFAVLATALVPFLWASRQPFLSRWRWWLPAFLLGLAQLWYLLIYGPGTNPNASDWDAATRIPLEPFSMFPEWTRLAVFWLFVNGDFLAWSTGFLLAALFAGGWRNRPDQAWRGLWSFLVQWRGYLLVCLGFFALINSYRYTFFWGDSNKFVLFLNLGLALMITIGAARWRGGDGRAFSRLLWLFFFALCVAPPVYEFHRDLVTNAPGKVLLFNRHEIAAAGWLRTNRRGDEAVLTAAYNIFHFVTPLAAAPTRAGIYGDSNPHRVQGRREDIRLIYENFDRDALARLDVRYICLSRGERRRYKVHPRWTDFTANQTAVAFSSGRPGIHDSVFLFDVKRLPPPATDAP